MILQRLTHFSAASLAIALTAATALSQSLPADIDPDSRARLPHLERQEMDEADLAIFDALPGRSPDGVLGGPLAFAAYNPGVARALFDLHNAAVAGTLDAHVRELAILVACRETHYDLEWNAHEPSAVRAGIAPEVIETVRTFGPVSGLDELDATVIRFGRQMFTDRKVESETFAKAVELLSERGVMDLVAVMNTYAVSGFYAIAVDERAPEGSPSLNR